MTNCFLWPPKWIPSTLVWSNYPDAVNYIPFFTYLGNTLTICGLATLGVLFSCPLVAYSMARIPWKGAKQLFAITLVVMMIPYQVTMIPIFYRFQAFRLGGFQYSTLAARIFFRRSVLYLPAPPVFFHGAA